LQPPSVTPVFQQQCKVLPAGIADAGRDRSETAAKAFLGVALQLSRKICANSVAARLDK